MSDMNISKLPPINAEALTKISADGLEASIKLKPPERGGTALTYGGLQIVLAKNRIIFGIDDSTLKLLANQPVYNTELVIARGVPCEKGTDARLVYHIETQKTLKPKEREDGSVDFKDLGAVQEVKQGQLLCEKIAALPGKEGTTVNGTRVAPVPGKDIALPAGQNTSVSEDQLRLYAAVDGHVTMVGAKINILNTFVVKGNVSVETGNIDFLGSVMVRGDVASGFAVRADGDVTIDGVVEAANITAGGNLIVRGGFLGGDKGVLEIGGNAACRFIESGVINVQGDLETTYIMNATVKCGGSINLVGKGLIRGGYVSARSSVTANVLGNPKASSANTVIEIGNDPALIATYEETKSKAEITAKNIADIEAMLSAMKKAEPIVPVPPETASKLEKANALLKALRPSYEQLQETLATLESHMARLGRGSINARKTAHAGLKIVIGRDVEILKLDHDRVSFYTNSEGITFAPLIER